MTHSPLPWTCDEVGWISDSEGHLISTPANAPFIVTAVNAHERMRKALEEIADFPIEEVTGEWRASTKGAAVDIACEALALCRECREPLTPEKQACDVCGAARAALGE